MEAIHPDAKLGQSNRRYFLRAGTAFIMLALILGGFFWNSTRLKPRKEAFSALEKLRVELNSPKAEAALNLVVLPASISYRTPKEQADFVRQTLRSEVTSEGLELLQERGKFGPLVEVFPEEAIRWAGIAGVHVKDCWAWRLDAPNFRTEVVFIRVAGEFRLLRCNNVRVPTISSVSL